MNHPCQIRGQHGFLFLPMLIVSFFFVLFFSTVADATHFRYGQLTWRPRPDLGPRVIEFTVVGSFRRNAYSGTDTDRRPKVGNDILEVIGDTKLFFGDGSPQTTILTMKVSAIDRRQNWIYGPLRVGRVEITTIRHTYPTTGNFTAFVRSCCRITSCDQNGGVGGLGNRHINNPAKQYRLETIVNVRDQNEDQNFAPTSSLFPIIAVRRNTVNVFEIPHEDNDGDVVRFRMADGFEATTNGDWKHPGDAGSGSPNPVTVSPDGVLSWDTTGAMISGDPTCPRSLYSTQVVMEDLDEGGNVKSKTPLDFFLLLGGIGNPPVFQFPTPCGELVFGAPRREVTMTVSVSDPDGDDEVTLNVVGLPRGATMTPPLPLTGPPGSTVSSTFRWTPLNAQVGRVSMTFAGTDRTNQSTCPITVEVSTCSDDAFGDPQVVNFDLNRGGDPLAVGVDLTGAVLQDFGVLMSGVSGVNGAPGVFTGRTGRSGSDTDDLIPESGMNYITTLEDPANEENSDYGAVIFDFIDPVTHLRRNVELAELWFLDVEDSVAVLTAYDGPGATGNVLDVAMISGAGSASQSRLEVGERLSDFEIASIRAEFGDRTDSAAIDSLCMEFSSSPLSIEDDIEDDTLIEVVPGGEVSIRLEIENLRSETYRGTFILFAITNPTDPVRRRARAVRVRNFTIPGFRSHSKLLSYRIPDVFGEMRAGEMIQLGHYLCSRDQVVLDHVTEMIQIVEE